MNKKTILFLLLLATIAAGSQLLPEQMQGWTLTEPVETFGTNLHEHINGAAPLYYEMGFDSLLVARYQNNNSELEINIYYMSGAESALAIYLLQAGNENTLSIFDCRNSTNPYQINLVKGNCFIQVNIYNGNEQTPGHIKAILFNVLQKTEPTTVTILDELSKTGLVKGSERIARGQYSMRQIFYFGNSDPLQLGSKIFAVAGEYENTDHVTTKIYITYPDSDQARKVFDAFITNYNPYLTILQHGPNRIILQDTRERYGVMHLNGPKIQIETKLENIPF